MPLAPHGPCLHFPCPHLRPCPVHPAERSGTQLHHTRAWYAKSKAYLKQHPICEACGRYPATEVDHIIPVAVGGTDDWDNLMAMDKACHSRKTARYDGGFGNAKAIAKAVR
jgi:5-methylcytosine-specific restriction protein A